MKNIVLVFLLLGGSLAGQQASAQGLRGCLGGTASAGCNHTAWMETKYNLATSEFMKALDVFYKEKVYSYSSSIGKSKQEFMLEIAQKIIDAIEAHEGKV